ncbi:hypothetical protein V8C34DRAFT_300986 [Trichoderma compactum]
MAISFARKLTKPLLLSPRNFTSTPKRVTVWDKFKKYQLAGRKALFKMQNRSRARNRQTKKDSISIKERAREARAVTDLKIRLDMANSLSVIANAVSKLATNQWRTVATYDREVADSYQGVLDDEADEIEYAESDPDEETEE